MVGVGGGEGGGEAVQWCGLLGTSISRGGGVGGRGSVLKIFVFVSVEVHCLLVVFSGLSLAD